MQLFKAVLAAWIALLPASPAAAATMVTGDSNPNLAGRADGYACCGGDSAPAQSPAEVTGLELESCASLVFSASGKVSYAGGMPTGNNPDGDDLFHMSNHGDGISAPLGVRTNALVGVFLGEESPTGTPTPGRLDFGAGLGFTTLAPEIGQIFFIGDGLTSDSKAGVFDGGEQAFQVPPGATRLFFGTVDGTGWYNNAGTFTVEISSTPDQSEFDCGDPAAPPGVAASDALVVLRAAVGTSLCQDCVCDVDRSGSIVASDAQAVLRHAVGQDVELRCDCCPLLE